MPTFARRPGVRLDSARITYDLAVRGLLEAEDIATASGLSLPAVRRALRGAPVTTATALRLIRLRSERPVQEDLAATLARPA
jgi:hypothetical protein